MLHTIFFQNQPSGSLKVFLKCFKYIWTFFTRSNYCVSFPMKHNLTMFHEVIEILHKNGMVKMHIITLNNEKLLKELH